MSRGALPALLVSVAVCLGLAAAFAPEDFHLPHYTYMNSDGSLIKIPMNVIAARATELVALLPWQDESQFFEGAGVLPFFYEPQAQLDIADGVRLGLNAKQSMRRAMAKQAQRRLIHPRADYIGDEYVYTMIFWGDYDSNGEGMAAGAFETVNGLLGYMANASYFNGSIVPEADFGIIIYEPIWNTEAFFQPATATTFNTEKVWCEMFGFCKYKKAAYHWNRQGQSVELTVTKPGFPTTQLQHQHYVLDPQNDICGPVYGTFTGCSSGESKRCQTWGFINDRQCYHAFNPATDTFTHPTPTAESRQLLNAIPIAWYDQEPSSLTVRNMFVAGPDLRMQPYAQCGEPCTLDVQCSLNKHCVHCINNVCTKKNN
jgi:hypothetical protein